MRVFLAIEIPDKIKKDLASIQRDLKPQIPGVRWEKPEKLHLTLIFLGPPRRPAPPKRGEDRRVEAGKVGEERIFDLKEVVREGVGGVEPFKLKLSGVRVFPSEKRPRVILAEVGEGIERLVELQQRLAETLTEAGFEFARLKKPHVTLGRFKRGAKHTRRVCKEPEDDGLRHFEVKEVVIVESKLHPAGAIHTPIAWIPL